MTTAVDRTVRLANDIATQFASRPDPDTAAEEIAAHVRSFWEPRMIATLLAESDRPGTELDPLAVRAADHLR